MNIIVVGGGKIGYYLTETLLEHGHRVTVVERDEQRCHQLAERFSATVIHGDGTIPGTLADAGAGRADALVAVSGQDEENLVCCQLAKHSFHVRRVIARVSNPKNEAMVRSLGVDVTVSSTAIIADLIEREVAHETVRTLLTFHHGDLNLLEVEVPPTSRAAGKTVGELARHLPHDCVLTALVRGHRVIFPRGDTAIRTGDTVMAVTSSESEERLRQVLLGER